MKINNDKIIECNRYNKRASSQLETGVTQKYILGSELIPTVIRAPYLCYESFIKENILPCHDVLEIGSGTGMHTFCLVATGANVTATDISGKSLEVIKKVFNNRVTLSIADMEALPFESNSFDVVVSAGSLSYGEPSLVDSEIVRVLRPGGLFICVDSLNHNPIYRFNRWIHYKKGERSKSTLKYMPTLHRIKTLSGNFNSSSVKYFGSISWVLQMLTPIFHQKKIAQISDFIDRLFRVRRSAFKFVLIAKNKIIS